MIRNLSIHRTNYGDVVNVGSRSGENLTHLDTRLTVAAKLKRGRKCEKCGDTGYKGRLGVFEVFRVTEPISKLILERAPASELEKAAISQGMVLMQQDGYLKVLDGVTTLEEVMRVAHT